MTFLSPAFLWAFLALIPLAAIYFLKVRPRKRTTTAYFLWEKILSERKATSLFNKLRDVLSLLLMLLAFAALVLALSRLDFDTGERKDLLILIDHSASMSARDGAGSRLDAARNAARDVALALNGNQRAAVASIAREMAFRSHLSVSPRQLIDAIDGIEETDFPFARSPMETLGKDARWSDDFRIILISDGSFEGADSLPDNIELLKVGAPVQNLGIVNADLQQLPDGRMGFYFQVASSFKEKTRADLLLKSTESDRIFRFIPLEVAPGVNPPETFYLDEAPAGRWIAEIELEDGFDKDNRAWLTVPPKVPVRVSVVAEERFFYETSIVAFERGGGTLQLVGDAPEIVVEHGSASGDHELAVVFAPDGDAPWWASVGEERDALAPREVLEDHPVLRHIDFSEISFIGARVITPPEGALVLVESEDGNPLVFQATREGRTAVVVNLDPMAADFYFSAWFPVLVHNAATHLAGRTESLAPVYRPGDTIPVPGFRADTETTFLGPADPLPVPVRTAKFGPLPGLGFFEFENPSETWPVAGSLITRSESLLDNTVVEASVRPLSRGHAPPHWLIVLALLILVGESILYHRRKVG